MGFARLEQLFVVITRFLAANEECNSDYLLVGL